MKYLYKFYWYCGRSGHLEGLFVATEDEVSSMIGEHVYFGEVLGKHSEVQGKIEKGDITKLDISNEAVLEVEKHLGRNWSGINPLDYRETYCEQCEESLQHDEWIVKYREEFEKDMCEECYEELIEDVE